jgi:hypothetical protein
VSAYIETHGRIIQVDETAAELDKMWGDARAAADDWIMVHQDGKRVAIARRHIVTIEPMEDE